MNISHDHHAQRLCFLCASQHYNVVELSLLKFRLAMHAIAAYLDVIPRFNRMEPIVSGAGLIRDPLRTFKRNWAHRTNVTFRTTQFMCLCKKRNIFPPTTLSPAISTGESSNIICRDISIVFKWSMAGIQQSRSQGVGENRGNNESILDTSNIGCGSGGCNLPTDFR